MKYFTREIWAGWQGDEKGFDKAMRDWKRNRSRYMLGLRKLAPGLGKGAKFFTDHSLHDGSLISLTISDCDGRRSAHLTRYLTTVKMEVLQWNEKKIIFELSYTGIKEIKVTSKNDLFPLDVSLFGDWGYDEILPAGRGAFQHNILFQTGTEISITFENFKFRRKFSQKKRPS